MITVVIVELVEDPLVPTDAIIVDPKCIIKLLDLGLGRPFHHTVCTNWLVLCTSDKLLDLVSWAMPLVLLI